MILIPFCVINGPHGLVRYAGFYLFIALTMLSSCQSAPEEPIKDKDKQVEETLQQKHAHLVKKDPAELSYEQLYDRTLAIWPVPYQEIYCDTRYGKAYVLTAGPEDARPLVLLHGMNASSSMWYPNIEALAQDHRVYAIDYFMEVNKSEKKGEIGGMADIMRWYQEVFNCLELEKFEMVGASRGGWLAVRIALIEKQRIKKLVLLSPAQTFIWIPPGKDLLSNIGYKLDPEKERLDDVLKTLAVHEEKIDQLYIDQYYRATTQAETDKTLSETIPFSEDDLDSLLMPVLVLVGEEDIINNERSLRKAQSRIKHVDTATIQDAGHFLSIDQAEEVNERVLKFLDQNRSRSF